MAATGAATSTSARDRWTGLSAFVAAKTPAVNSSESPGRKKPSNSPVSAKMISKMPSSPNVSTRDRASSQLTARTASARCTLPGYRAPLDGDLGASGEHAVTERLVVVGGDAAGMSAASQARPRRAPDDLEIVAFERGSTTSYSACGIPYWIGDVVSDRNRLISRHLSTFRDSFAIDVRIRTEVEEINLDRREVRARGLETGSTYAVGFDALLVGTGYIGIELAEALTVRGLDVMLVEMAPEPMSTLDPDMGAMVRTAMNGLGITIHSGERVEAIEAGEGRVAAAVVTDLRMRTPIEGVWDQPRRRLRDLPRRGRYGGEQGLQPRDRPYRAEGVRVRPGRVCARHCDGEGHHPGRLFPRGDDDHHQADRGEVLRAAARRADRRRGGCGQADRRHCHRTVERDDRGEHGQPRPVLRAAVCPGVGAGVDRRAQGLGRGRGGHRRARRADLPLSSSGTSASTVAASNRAYSHALPPPAPCRRRSRMPIATPDVYAEMLTRAKDNAFAYPGINVTSSQTLNAALRGFAEAESDGIVQVSTGGAEFLSGTTVKDMVLGAGALAEYAHHAAKAFPIQIALHTDHCPKNKLDGYMRPLIALSQERVNEGREPLFQSHMWDGSAVPLEENLQIAEELLAACNKAKIIMEMEIGVVGGEEDGVVGEINEKLYTTPEDALRTAEMLGTGEKGRYMLAATFGNVHGVYKPGNVKLRPSILKEIQDAVGAKVGRDRPFELVFHGGSGSLLEEIRETLDYGVVKMNVDTDTQYAYTRPVADHMLRNYDAVLKVDGEVGNKKFYDPRSWGKAAETGMANRVVVACEDLRSAGNKMS